MTTATEPRPKRKFLGTLGDWFASLTSAEREQSRLAASTYDELVASALAAETEGGKLPSPASVLDILRAAGKTNDDLRADVVRAQQIAEKRAVFAGRADALAQKDAAESEVKTERQRFESLRLQHIAELDRLEAECRDARLTVEHCEAAGRELDRLLANDIDAQILARKRELLRRITELRSLHAGQGLPDPMVENIPDFESRPDVVRLRELEREIQAIQKDRSSARVFSTYENGVFSEREGLAIRVARLRAIHDKFDEMKSLHAEVAQLDSQLETIRANRLATL